MATHSSILAWQIPWPEEPGGLQSMGSQSQTGLITQRLITPCYNSEVAKRVDRNSLSRDILMCLLLPECY